MLTINFQSLWKKQAELCTLINETDCHIVIGTETWLTPDVNNSELLLPNFHIFRKDRSPRADGVTARGGGVMIAVSNFLSCEEIPTSSDTKTIFVKIKLRNKKTLIIGSVYRPPNFSLDQSTKTIKEIYNIFDKNKRAVFSIGGDFNIPDIDWANQEVIGNQYQKEINQKFLEMSQDLGLQQLVNFPTRGTSTLDLLFTTHPSFVKNCSPHPGLGDHEAIQTTTTLNPPKKKPVSRRIQLWNKADESAIQKAALDLKIRFLETYTVKDNVNDIWIFI